MLPVVSCQIQGHVEPSSLHIPSSQARFIKMGQREFLLVFWTLASGRESCRECVRFVAVRWHFT